MATTNLHDEKDLLRELRGGNHRAFETLYHRYAKPLYWKINSMVKESEEADELVQALFVKVWEKREQITIEQSFEAYLYKIAQRMAVDYFRSLDSKSRLHSQIALQAEATTRSTEESHIAKETQAILDKVIEQLPEQRRRVFILCKMEGKSHQEASEIMGISPNTVHNHLVKAVSEVKLKLETAGLKLSPWVLFAVILN